MALAPAAAAALAVLSALRVPGPLSPRNASYVIEASLDERAHTVVGRELITWRNLASGPASELVFHLYMNAFKNEGSTFFREARGEHREDDHFDPHGWGAIDVKHILVDGVDLTSRFTVDDTLGRVPLSEPIVAGDDAVIEIEWTTLLPKVLSRAGYVDDYFAVTQWFPKIGVYECAGAACAWRAGQYHWNSEFFADFGVYDVAIDVPARFVVGATGVPTGDERKGDRRRLSFHAEDVHDFAFAACPRFLERTEKVGDPWGSVEVVLLAIPGHADEEARHFATARAQLAELERRLGPYPYSRLTIVDTVAGGEGAGGMEYPTLFFTDHMASPRGVHALEFVTAHELAHQYFQGIVASDEVEEAWLDEGLAQTATEWGLGRQFGAEGSIYDLAGHRLSATEADRIGLRMRRAPEPIDQPSYAYVDNDSYGSASYERTHLLLRTVETLVGSERYEAGMRRYYEGARFGHPHGEEFVRRFDEGAGAAELAGFWRAGLSSGSALDYEVLSVATRERVPEAGLYDVDGGERREVSTEAPANGWVSEVVVQRRGELVAPVTLRTRLEGGEVRVDHWDGGSDGRRWKRFVIEGEKKAVSAELDGLPLDLRRWNDGRLAEPERGPGWRLDGGYALLVSTLLAVVGY